MWQRRLGSEDGSGSGPCPLLGLPGLGRLHRPRASARPCPVRRRRNSFARSCGSLAGLDVLVVGHCNGRLADVMPQRWARHCQLWFPRRGTRDRNLLLDASLCRPCSARNPAGPFRVSQPSAWSSQALEKRGQRQRKCVAFDAVGRAEHALQRARSSGSLLSFHATENSVLSV